MIRRLSGTVVERGEAHVVVDVHGVGYLVSVNRRARFTAGADVVVWVYTHVREDALQLLGFETDLEREVFELFLTVPSVGPVKALAILENPVDELARLIERRDHVGLAKLPGIGKKTAERIVLDLRDKLGALVPAAALTAPRPAPGSPIADLTSALTNLGYRPKPAADAAERAIERLGPNAELSALVREALSHVQPR